MMQIAFIFLALLGLAFAIECPPGYGVSSDVCEPCTFASGVFYYSSSLDSAPCSVCASPKVAFGATRLVSGSEVLLYTVCMDAEITVSIDASAPTADKAYVVPDCPANHSWPGCAACKDTEYAPPGRNTCRPIPVNSVQSAAPVPPHNVYFTCKPGYYFSGATDQPLCEVVPAGFYRGEADQAVQECPKDTISNTGATAKADCVAVQHATIEVLPADNGVFPARKITCVDGYRHQTVADKVYGECVAITNQAQHADGMSEITPTLQIAGGVTTCTSSQVLNPFTRRCDACPSEGTLGFSGKVVRVNAAGVTSAYGAYYVCGCQPNHRLELIDISTDINPGNRKTSRCVERNINEIYDAKTNTMKVCEAGKYTDHATNTCLTCNSDVAFTPVLDANGVITEGNSVCASPPRTMYFDTTSGKLALCADLGDKNMFCFRDTNGKLLKVDECPEGTYYNSAHEGTACEPCVTEGLTSSSCKNGVRTVCSPLHISVDNECVFCDGKINREANTCEACPENQVPTPDHTACIECAAGQYYDGTKCANCSDLQGTQYCNGNSLNNCNKQGFYLNVTTEARTCETCPAGAYCVDGAKTDCPTDHVSLPQSSTCAPCPAHTSSNLTNECVIDNGAKFNVKTASPDRITAAELARATGTLTSICDTGICAGGVFVACAQGQKPNGLGTACTACPAGTYGDGSECYKCTGQTYQATTGRDYCTNCHGDVTVTAGFNVGCKSCDTDSYFDSKCEPCKDLDENKYCEVLDKTAVVTTCALGYVDAARKTCTSCLTFAPTIAQDNATYCKLNASTGDYTKDTCPINGVLNSTMTTCDVYTHDSGKYVRGHRLYSCNNLNGNNYCQNTSNDPATPGYAEVATCPIGKIITPGRTSCDDCPAGQYCDGTTAVRLCTSLTGANYCTKGEAAGTTVTSTCPQGSYVTSDRDQCKVCDTENGEYHYCPGEGVRKTCPVGSYLTNGTETGNTDCKTCGEADYCPNQTTLVTCPRGALCSATELVNCGAGSYRGDADDCHICDMNYFCDGLTKNNCPAGLISSTGSSKVEECLEPTLPAGAVAGIAIGVAVVVVAAGAVGLHFAIRRPKSQAASQAAASSLMDAMGVL